MDSIPKIELGLACRTGTELDKEELAVAVTECCPPRRMRMPLSTVNPWRLPYTPASLRVSAHLVFMHALSRLEIITIYSNYYPQLLVMLHSNKTTRIAMYVRIALDSPPI